MLPASPIRTAGRAGLLALLLAAPLLAGPLPAAAQDGTQDGTQDGAASRRQVAGPEDLALALSEAGRPGAPHELLLEGGDYGTLRLVGGPACFDRPVTIASADPTRPARFTGLAVRDACNVIFDGLLFDYSYRRGDNDLTRPFMLHASRDMVVRNSVFDGDLAQGGPEVDNGFGMATGLDLRDDDGIRIEHNLFRDFFRGLLLNRSRNLALTGNEITGMRSEGLNAAAVEGLLIEGNLIHDFRVSPKSEDHRDMIQFWTAGTETPSTDITIRGNLLNSGSGLYTQSIFIRNERVDAGQAGEEMYYRNLLIEENVIVNAHLHGITVGQTEGLTIRNNTLIHNPLSNGSGGSAELWTPRIRLSPDSNRVSVTGNITPQIDGPERRRDWDVRDNVFVQDLRPERPGWYGSVFAGALRGAPGDLASFRYLPQGPAGRGGGAAALRGDPRGFPGPVGPEGSRITDSATGAAPGLPLPAIGVTPDPDHLNRIAFAATADPPPADPATAYEWQIGTTAAKGAEIAHVFPGPGRYEVALVLHGPGEAESRAALQVEIPPPELLRFGPQGFEQARLDAEGPGWHWQPLTLAGAEPGVPLQLGEGQPLLLPFAAVAGLSGARDFDLELRFRSRGTTPAGELLRVDGLLALALTPAGGLALQVTVAGTGRPLALGTGPLQLHDGAWHQVAIAYDAAADQVTATVDGTQRIRSRVTGPLETGRGRGLSIGAGQGKGFTGEIAELTLQANRRSFLPATP